MVNKVNTKAFIKARDSVLNKASVQVKKKANQIKNKKKYMEYHCFKDKKVGNSQSNFLKTQNVSKLLYTVNPPQRNTSESTKSISSKFSI